MATSPLVRPPSAEAGDGWASRRPAPMAPTPTAAPLSTNERRFVKRRDGAMSSTIFLLQKLWRATRLRLASMTDPTMRPMWVRHNSPVRLPDRARRSEANPPAVNVQRGGVGVVRVIAREVDGGRGNLFGRGHPADGLADEDLVEALSHRLS